MKNLSYYYLDKNIEPKNIKSNQSNIFKRNNYKGNTEILNYIKMEQNKNGYFHKEENELKHNLKKNRSQNFLSYKKSEQNNNKSSLNIYDIYQKMPQKMQTKKKTDKNIMSNEYFITDAPLNYNYSYNSISKNQKTNAVSSYHDSIEELKTNINEMIKTNRNRTTDLKNNKANTNTNKTNNIFFPKKYKRHSYLSENQSLSKIENEKSPLKERKSEILFKNAIDKMHQNCNYLKNKNNFLKDNFYTYQESLVNLKINDYNYDFNDNKKNENYKYRTSKKSNTLNKNSNDNISLRSKITDLENRKNEYKIKNENLLDKYNLLKEENTILNNKNNEL